MKVLHSNNIYWPSWPAEKNKWEGSHFFLGGLGGVGVGGGVGWGGGVGVGVGVGALYTPGSSEGMYNYAAHI